MIPLGDDVQRALQTADDDDRIDRVWRVCSYHLERVELEVSAWAALPRVPVGHVFVEISLARGCDFLPTDTWDVLVEGADGDPLLLVPKPCFGPPDVFQTFTCPQDALAGLIIRSLTYKSQEPTDANS